MNILAVDVGTKRWGLAWCDDVLGVVLPYGVVHSVEEVDAVVRQERIDRVVVGLPLSLDGTENDHSVAIRRIAEHLEKNGAEVILVDERFTSQLADRLESGGASRDERAAMMILQSYLDRQSG